MSSSDSVSTTSILQQYEQLSRFLDLQSACHLTQGSLLLAVLLRYILADKAVMPFLQSPTAAFLSQALQLAVSLLFSSVKVMGK